MAPSKARGLLEVAHRPRKSHPQQNLLSLIFSETLALQNNLATVDFSLLLTDLMTIADEVDSQLKQND